jgi:hypothetical protein
LKGSLLFQKFHYLCETKAGAQPGKGRENKMNTLPTIKAGQTLTATSICDSNCIFKAEILERKGNFVTIKTMGETKRVKVFSGNEGEYIYALGKYSMCPIFRAK